MQSLQDLDLLGLVREKIAQGGYFPSPAFWEDQVLYFLLVDRFADGHETPQLLFQPPDAGNAVGSEAAARQWRQAGTTWCGGNLAGLKSKIPYLRDLGVTAIWLSPIFKQIKGSTTYHGYGIQNFLETDTDHFGTKAELRELVAAAHQEGIYVILDIILNHTGDVFAYQPNRYPVYSADGQLAYYDVRWDGQPYPFQGFYNAERQVTAATPRYPDDAVWPIEFQNPAWYTRKGRINNWEHYPEYIEGDFFDLKDLDLGNDDLSDFHPSPALRALCEVYKYWIAFADVDGFRIDTVKHMGKAATRFFCSVIHEFAQHLGKDRFYLIGEITGGRANAFQTVELTGLNAALGIDDVQDKLDFMVRGTRNPEEYFNLFRNSIELGKDSHVWINNRIITMIDDHDQVRKGGSGKARFAAVGGENLLICAIGVNLCTMGTPCLYYGSEQAFDGQGGSDQYIRECMLAGPFGAFRSQGKHFFNPKHRVYRETAKIAALRRALLPLRRGRQYLRAISGNGFHFGPPKMQGGSLRSVVAWSRIFDQEEVVCAFNNNLAQPQQVWVTIDQVLNRPGEVYRYRYATGQAADQLAGVPVEARNGCALYLDVPPGAMVILTKA